MDRIVARPLGRLSAAVIILGVTALSTPGSAQSVSSARANGISVRIPDLANYNCAAVTANTTAQVRHLGQVIKGRYHEWQEIYVANGDKQALACISKVAPQARSLSPTEAAKFLTDSAAIGVSSVPANTAAVSPPDLADVKPQPLLRKSGGIGTHLAQIPPPIAASSEDSPAPSTAAPQAAQNSLGTATSADASTLDNRVAATTTQAYPWNTVGYLQVSYANGDNFRCSGTVVSAYVVLTAGHCIHNNTEGGYVSRVQFFPGQYQATLGDNRPIRPYGGNSSFAAAVTTQTWTQISGNDSYPVNDYGYDIAAVEFKTPFTFTSTFMPVLYSNTVGPVTNAGYPASYQSQTAYGMYTASGTELSSSLEGYNVREFAIYASGGDSGSPFFYVDPATNRPALVGSLSYGDDTSDTAGGPWYDSWNESLLTSWVTWTPAAASNSAPAGMHVANIFSSAQPTSQSYLRFYNEGSAAGTVALTLVDPISGNALANWTSPSIPAGASLQFFIQDIEQQASQSFTKPFFYSLLVNPNIGGYMQHVLWQRSDNSLTNLTNCDSGVMNDQKVLMAVHSSLLAGGYPSTVVVYNTGTAAVNVQLGIYDARNGNRLGTYATGTIQPNGQVSTTTTAMESAARITPSSGMYHYIISADTSFTGYMQHVVNNTSDGVVTDMTEVCKLTPAS